MTSSYAHQDAGVKRIQQDGYVHGLLWGMGSGKTRTAIKALEQLRADLGRPIKVLIVAPKSVMHTWGDQFDQHCGSPYVGSIWSNASIVQRIELLEGWHDLPPSSPGINFAVLGYSTFAGRTHKEALLKAIKKAEIDIIICDEGHALRGMSNTSRLMARIAKVIPRRLLLTGTATPNGYQDLYTQWAFLDPEAWLDVRTGKMASRTAWENHFAIKGGFQGRQIVAWRNTEELMELVARRSSVVVTRDCIDLPPVTTTVHRFELSPSERLHYEEMRKDLLTVVEDETLTAANKVVSILRLRQICAGFLPFEDGSVAEIGRTRHDIALDLIENILASEKRVVVFAWSKHELSRLFTALCEKAPWNADVMKIDGSTSAATRQFMLSGFGSDSPERMVLLGQVSTVNAGINELVTANQAIFLSMTNSRADFEQAKARLDRPGQTSPVQFHVVAGRGTIDEAILKAFESKADIEASLIRYIKEQP